MPDLELQVMDRNGFLLYNGVFGWDGTYKGKPMDPDTYFYLVRYPDRKQQEHTKKGFITRFKRQTGLIKGPVEIFDVGFTYRSSHQMTVLFGVKSFIKSPDRLCL